MEKSGFFNSEVDSEGNYDREYLAEDFASYFSRFISNGVFPNPSTGLQVIESPSPGMSVVLSPGYAYINGYQYENTDPLTFNIDVADGQLDRKDTVFIRFYKDKREIKATYVKGRSSASAIPPSLIRTPDYWDLCVGVINVNAGVTKITQDLIEDRRLDTEVCGIVVNVVQTIDTHTLYLQIQKDLENFQMVSQAGFDKWFEDINSKLGTEPATSLQKQINTLVDNTRVFSATFLLDGWNLTDGVWAQTASCEGMMDDYNVTDPWTYKTGVESTDKELIKSFEAIYLGRKLETIRGGIYAEVRSKPTCDVPIYMRRVVTN